MRTQLTLPLTLLAIFLVPTINALTLSQFQPINGFSAACNNAYDTPLSGCTASDFSTGNCSIQCIEFLDALTKIINAECSGTSAYPNTLVGAFFQGDGTRILCPNDMGESSGQGQSGGGGGGAAVYTLSSADNSVTSTADTFTSTTATPSSILRAVSASSAASASSASAASAVIASSATTTVSKVFAETTVPPIALLPSPTTKTVDTKGSYTSASTQATSTSSSSGGTSNGGGTILDVGSNGSSSSCHNARLEAWVLSLLAGSAGLACFL